MTHRPPRHCLLLILAAALLMGGAAGCDPSDTAADAIPPSTGARGADGRRGRVGDPSATAQESSPIGVVRLAREHRLAGHLTDMGDLIVADQRVVVVQLVGAVDELVAADESLTHALSEAFGPAAAATFHRPNLANIIGVFSHDVDVLSEVIDGDRARVAVQIVDRLPLDYVEVVRVDGVWRIRTDPPIEGLPEALRNLAKVLSSLARETLGGKYTFAQFEREYRLRTAGSLRRIRELGQGA